MTAVGDQINSGKRREKEGPSHTYGDGKRIRVESLLLGGLDALIAPDIREKGLEWGKCRVARTKAVRVT
jgi:hypothetical protein